MSREDSSLMKLAAEIHLRDLNRKVDKAILVQSRLSPLHACAVAGEGQMVIRGSGHGLVFEFVEDES